jgi:hypothetical protein
MHQYCVNKLGNVAQQLGDVAVLPVTGGFSCGDFIEHLLLSYLFTPWSRVLLEKLTGFAASQEIPPIYGTRKFITVPTSARHLSLS